MWPQSWPGPLAALPALSPAEQQPKGTSIADAGWRHRMEPAVSGEEK